MWKQCVEGRSGATCTSGTQTNMTWQDAANHCESLSFADYSDWYLPNINELLTLIDYGFSSGTYIDTAYFPNTPASNTWSSSVRTSDSASGEWIVSFSNGSTSYSLETSSFTVRCVRQN